MLRTVKDTYKKSFTITGRTGVLDLWKFSLFQFIVFIIIFVFGFLMIKEGSEPMLWSSILFFFVALNLPTNISLQIRRLHDVGLSGWWIVIIITPYAVENTYIEIMTALLVLVINLSPGGTPNKYDEKELKTDKHSEN